MDKLEDLKHLSDLLNNVKIGQGQLRLISETYFVLKYRKMGNFRIFQFSRYFAVGCEP